MMLCHEFEEIYGCARLIPNNNRETKRTVWGLELMFFV